MQFIPDLLSRVLQLANMRDYNTQECLLFVSSSSSLRKENHLMQMSKRDRGYQSSKGGAYIQDFFYFGHDLRSRRKHEAVNVAPDHCRVSSRIAGPSPPALTEELTEVGSQEQ